MSKATVSNTTDSLYSIHPGVKMVQKWASELKDKTGRSLEEWGALVKKDGPKDEKSRRNWLKTKHKLGTNSAWWIAERAEGKGGLDSDPHSYLEAAVQYVAQQYAGPRASLRPLYDRLLGLGKSLGSDVQACPCKTIVPLYREHVFAQIKPSTNTRIDLGLALAHHKGKLPNRMIDTGGLQKKDRITHRIPLASIGEIDEEVKKWIKIAYDLDG
jgi:hypothetical protein